jgi:hypothetical protein
VEPRFFLVKKRAMSCEYSSRRRIKEQTGDIPKCLRSGTTPTVYVEQAYWHAFLNCPPAVDTRSWLQVIDAFPDDWFATRAKETISSINHTCWKTEIDAISA